MFTPSQQLMIDDGLPPSLIVDQQERNKFWLDHPPKRYSAHYLEKKIDMTKEEITLLFELKASKDRGAASLGCSHHHIVSISKLERLGFAEQRGFGPTSFRITDAGLEELKKHKKPLVIDFVAPPAAVDEKVLKVLHNKTGKRPTAKTPKVAKAVKVNPDLSPICTECSVHSKNRAAALDFLYSKIGKQQSIASVMKVVYETDKASEGALDTVIRALQRDLGNSQAKDKYEVRRIKDAKGVYSYGLYKK